MVKLEPLLPCVQEKALRLNASSQFTIDHELALPLPAFAVGDVSGKVWSTLNRQGFTARARLASLFIT